MKGTWRTLTPLTNWLGVVALAAIPAGLFATTILTSLTVDETAEFGSGATFGTSIISTVSIGYANYPPGRGMAVGQYLTAGTGDDVVIGQWNLNAYAAYFRVGIGSGTEDRRNAFEVLTDGSVIVNQLQGDITAGEFGE